MDADELEIMTEEEWTIILKERTEYIDKMKTVDDAGRWRTSHPFWIHYQWKGDKYNGARGQFQYFRSYNYKYAFERFKNVVRSYERKGLDITFSLITGDYPRRQFLLSSDPMDDKGTQTLIGWLWWNRMLAVPAQYDDKKWWTLITKAADSDKVDLQLFENADTGKAVDAFWKDYKEKGRPQKAFVLLGGDNTVRMQKPTTIRSGF